MSKSSRKTYDTEIITVRQVNAYNADSSLIPALNVLTADGAGGTFWGVPSTLGVSPAINTLVVDNVPVVADASYNTFSICTLQGMGSFVSDKQINLFAKGFSEIDISGANTIRAYSNAIVSPTLTLVGQNGIAISSDPTSGSIYFTGQYAVAGSNYSYSQMNITSNAANPANNTYLTATSPAGVLNITGVGDVLLSTQSPNSVFIEISTFNSSNYLNTSTVAHTAYASTLSTVSTLFTDLPKASTLSGMFVSSLLSTSGSLQTRIQNGETNVMQNYTNIDFFKVCSTSLTLNAMELNAGLVSSISYASSININSYRGILGGNSNAGVLTLSSASLRLDSMSTMIKKNAQVRLTMCPSMRFDFQVPTDTVFYVSSYVQAGLTPVPNTTFVRPWLLRGGTGQNLYADTISFTIPGSSLNNSGLTSTYTICHRIQGFTGVTYGSLTSNAEQLISGDNTLSVLLTGSNYTTIY